MRKRISNITRCKDCINYEDIVLIFDIKYKDCVLYACPIASRPIKANHQTCQYAKKRRGTNRIDHHALLLLNTKPTTNITVQKNNTKGSKTDDTL